MIIRVLAEGFALGLSSGIFCVGSCAPFLFPYLMAGAKAGIKANAILLVEFLLGRFVGYVIFGMAAGWMGGLLKPHLSEPIRAATLILAALLLVISAFYQIFPKNPFCDFLIKRRALVRVPFLFGFLLGINICPPFLLGVARLLEIGNVWLGALFFSAFFVSSTLYLLPIFVVTPLFKGERLRRIGIMASFIVGVCYLGAGLYALLLSLPSFFSRLSS